VKSRDDQTIPFTRRRGDSSETGSGVRERDPELLPRTRHDPDCRWSVSTHLIDDPEPRGLGLKLVVANFSEQNH
jgi:hypothetical protein